MNIKQPRPLTIKDNERFLKAIRNGLVIAFIFWGLVYAGYRATYAQGLYPPSCSVAWDKSDGATGYIIEVNGVENDVGDVDTVLCAAVEITQGSYELRAKAYAEKQQSAWSEVLTVSIGTLQPPTLLRLTYSVE